AGSDHRLLALRLSDRPALRTAPAGRPADRLPCRLLPHVAALRRRPRPRPPCRAAGGHTRARAGRAEASRRGDAPAGAATRKRPAGGCRAFTLRRFLSAADVLMRIIATAEVEAALDYPSLVERLRQAFRRDIQVPV